MSAAVTAANARRRELLLVDDSDDEIAKIDAEADRHRLTLERLDELEPRLLARLHEAQTDARRRLWVSLREQHDAAALDFAAAFKAAIEKRDAMIAVAAEAHSASFDREAAARFPQLPLILTTDALQLFENALDRARDGDHVVVKPSPPPAPPKPRMAEKPAPAAPPEKPKKRQRPPLPEKPPAGFIRVTCLKSGYEAPDGEQLAVGDEIDLPEFIARRAAENSAVKFVEVLA
ncbi:hypothetical protein [Terrarubrum flagellatum]|uniref:hypothetical protein n=1 Tax=Terrirubrum flagellatum TaxID=2895980 RepID=UPI0031452919